MLIVDANVLVAVMSRRDTHHARMNELLESRHDEFPLTPYLVAEAAYLVQKVAGPDAQITFMQAVRDRIFRQETLSEADLARIVELMGQSRGFPLGAADASVIVVAELLKIQEIASLDGRFRAVLPRGVDCFTLVARARHTPRRPQSRERSPPAKSVLAPRRRSPARPRYGAGDSLLHRAAVQHVVQHHDHGRTGGSGHTGRNLAAPTGQDI